MVKTTVLLNKFNVVKMAELAVVFDVTKMTGLSNCGQCGKNNGFD